MTGNRAVAFMFIPLGIVLALFTVGYAAMSRYIENAGAFYAYVSRASAGSLVSGLRSSRSSPTTACRSGSTASSGSRWAALWQATSAWTSWWFWCLVAGVVIALLGVLQIDLNAKVLAVMLGLEVLIVALFDFAIPAIPVRRGSR